MPLTRFLERLSSRQGLPVPAPPNVRGLVDHLAERWGCEVVEAAAGDIAIRVDENTAALVVLDSAPASGRSVRALASAVRRAAVTVVVQPPARRPDAADAATDAERRLRELCEALKREPAFAGWTRTDASAARSTAVAIFEGEHVPGPQPAPDDFRVLAVMAAFNERDIIVPMVRRLTAQAVDVHLLDNWSTDGTVDLLRRSVPDARLTIEQFPTRATGTFDLERVLTRVEEVAIASTADWIIHHDADEIRQPPWSGLDLRGALHTVQRRGFDAVDHTVLDFQPVDDGFTEGEDPATYFRHCEFGARPGSFVQIKAWRNRADVSLAASGGHSADFAGRRVFPYKFLLRHYPLRSQRHAERKVFGERRPRWNPGERERGWHIHYDAAEPGQSFLHDRGSLLTFDEDFCRRYLAEVLSGSGITRLGV